MGQDSGLVAASSADFQNALVLFCGRQEHLAHKSNDKWLRYRLGVANWQGRIDIGIVKLLWIQEQVPRYSFKGIQHSLVADAFGGFGECDQCGGSVGGCCDEYQEYLPAGVYQPHDIDVGRSHRDRNLMVPLRKSQRIAYYQERGFGECMQLEAAWRG